MKTTLVLAALLVFVLVGGYQFHAYKQTAASFTYTAPVQTETNTSGKTTENTTTTTVTSTSTTTVPEPKKLGYTSAQVAAHATSANCWTSINGNVYDLTAWIGTHPGGESAIIQLCGTDGTSAFMGQHGGDNRANNALARFIIGPLTK